MRKIIVIANDMRSTYNVGSLLRTAEGLGVQKVYFTGYTPYPATQNDERLPHISTKLTEAIEKTALGAEKLMAWEHHDDINALIEALKNDGFAVCALEQTKDAIELPGYKVSDKSVLLLGTEVTGIPDDLLALCDTHLVIPMRGKKESFNVVQAAAMALYHFTFS